MARSRLAPLILCLLCACDPFFALGPNGCDEEHPCTSLERPYCDLPVRRCVAAPPAPPPGAGCRDHDACESRVCDRFGAVMPRPGTCVPPADVATVSTAADLQAALSARRGVRLQPGTYTGAFAVARHSVVLAGPGPGMTPALLTPDRPGSVLRVGEQARLTLDGIVVRGGKGMAGHGIFCEAADSLLFLRRTEVSQHEGRGVFARCPVTITQSIIGAFRESLRNQGGGVWAESAAVIHNSFVSYNGTAQSAGGGITLLFGERKVPREVVHVTFVANLSGADGAAINCNDAGPTEVWHALFWNNRPLSGHFLFAGKCSMRAAATDDIMNSGGDFTLLTPDRPPRFRPGSQHLMPNSPGVDPVPAIRLGPKLEEDFDGDVRPQGTGTDYGADEVVPP
jgi:hypothetical protein